MVKTLPIKVLQIVTQMNRAGMESRVMDIYRHLDRSKVQFDFYTFRPNKGQYDSEILSLGGKIYYNPPLSIAQLHKTHADLSSFLRTNPEYKIVHAHMNAWCGILLRAAKMAGVPIRIAHSRTALDKAGLRNMVKNTIKLPVNRYATHRFAVSRKAGIWLFGKKAEKLGLIEVWPNAIEYDKFRYAPEVRQAMRNSLNVGEKFVIMHVGNCRFEKNHQFLLKVFAEVKAMDASAQLILVGGGNWDEVGKIAKLLGVADSVTFTGSRPDVNCLLQAGDVFVFPSLYEGLPGAVLEAQAAGLPCIISDSITDEVCITPLVEQLPLSLSVERWAEKVLACKDISREGTEADFIRSGFDINNLVDKMTEFYLFVAGNEVV